MKILRFVLLLAAISLMASQVLAEEITIEGAPPVVVASTPKAGSRDIDPGLREIRVTFSKDMMNASWSWVQMSLESFPKTAGNPKYESDGRTCVLPVKLEPGKTYAIWINSARHANFKDSRGQSAIPYLIVFQTRK